MSEITISVKAYCKIILHAAKYPHCSINGVLLGKCSSSKSKDLEIVDAVPLFHISLNLTPMAEVALTLIDQVASTQGLLIVGYYAAHENLKDVSLERCNHRIPDKIAENFNSACLLVVDNRKLGSQLDSLALRISQFADGKYKPVDLQRVSLTPAHSLDVCTSLLEKRSYKGLVDFDNHLDNIRLDWKNAHINKEIDELI